MKATSSPFVACRTCSCKLYPYTYPPLEEGDTQIRLLELEPSLEAAANIHAKLRTYAIDSAPAYTAISYKWRSKNPLRAIHLDGMRFFARDNLVDMFRCLRDPHQPRMLWIDAVSIDQSNVQERNSQVEKMGTIYERAETVVAWLDLRDEDALRKVSQLLSTPRLWQYTDFRKKSEDAQELWGALETVMEHDYWTRSWIIQEIVIADRVTLQSKSFAMPLSLLEDFAYWVMVRRDKSKWIHPDWKAIATAKCIQLCEHRTAASSLSNSRQPLQHLLMRYADFECMDPRDKVYSVLNLCIQLDPPITVNYAFTCAELFVEVLWCLIWSQELGAREVVGTAALLYKHLLCDYASETERRNAVYAVRSTLKFNIEPYPRGHVASGALSYDERLQLLDGIRKQAAGMRALPSHRSYYRDYEKWVNFPDVQKAPLVQPEHLSSFAVEFDLGESTRAHAASFGLATCPVKAGDQIYQFSNTDFALVLRREHPLHVFQNSFVDRVVGSAALVTGPNGAAPWNPFIKSTDISSWLRSFESTPDDGAAYNSVRANEINVVQLMKLLSLVCPP
ncbi:uncharacterized protein Z520_08141 [Fonsecaea multimorphosa CBS 102226]|uniref:Heterokaryon incompatibility domain-containing protein n=1 Tax=Fonsecaea multimorphosa CBS 102226 TaxID=1442371 RepID=A0A0D2KIB5_9EURO|nr:uncharacterized protein Z520_08141 [Fonsecaea multimorphosa CBS 102226]KIX96363.1 hypothetical protein Z520_08141 [Fonsecaea multimorphosa CBS 102226]OAL22022.1 hypothetical protein AYO22_07619 [Fonsecaea multimorphosa]